VDREGSRESGYGCSAVLLVRKVGCSAAKTGALGDTWWDMMVRSLMGIRSAGAEEERERRARKSSSGRMKGGGIGGVGGRGRVDRRVEVISG
jgi:hypothetical protein